MQKRIYSISRVPIVAIAPQCFQKSKFRISFAIQGKLLVVRPCKFKKKIIYFQQQRYSASTVIPKGIGQRKGGMGPKQDQTQQSKH
jgi:hypothetical protein